MDTPLAKQRAFGIDVPFSFFLYNDHEDFDDFLSFLVTKVLGEKYQYKYYEGRSEKYAIYQDVWIDLWFHTVKGQDDANYAGNNIVWVLTFTVYAQLKE